MGLSEMLFGKGGEMVATPTMSGGQQDLFSQLLSGLGGPLQGMLGSLQGLLSGDSSAFEKPLMRQFEESTIPGLAERFAGMGAGAQDSSAFQQSLGAAGAGLQENLGALRGNLQQQAMGQLSSLLGMGINTPTFQWQNMPGTEGALNPILKGLGSAAGGAFGAGLGGGLAGLLGGGGWKSGVGQGLGFNK